MPTPYYPAEELDEAEYAQQNTISRQQDAGNLTAAQAELLAEAEYQAAVRALMDSEPEEMDTQEPAAEAVQQPEPAVEIDEDSLEQAIQSEQELHRLTFDVQINRDQQSSDIVATADVKINGVCTIRNIKIMDDGYGLEVVMPRTKMLETGRYQDACYFSNREMRSQLSIEVLRAYQGYASPQPEPDQELPALSPCVQIHCDQQDYDIAATADVRINDVCTIRNVKIRNGDYGLEVVMPKTKIPDTGRLKDACYFPNREMRAQFDLAVMTAYQQELQQAQDNPEQQIGGMGMPI